MKGLYYSALHEEYSANLARSVASRIDEVTVIARPGSLEFGAPRFADKAEIYQRLENAHVKTQILHGGYRSPESFRTVRRTLQQKLDDGYGYFNIQQTDDPRFLWVVARMPTVLTLHEAQPREGVTRYSTGLRRKLTVATERLYRRLADVIVVHTESSYDALTPRDKAKAIVIPHGVPTTDLGPPPCSRIILFFGKATPYKGLDVLLEAMPEVWKHEPTAQLRILASPGGDENRHSITDSRISATWDGFSNATLIDALTEAQVVCLPYISASGTGVGSRAYGCGRPIVASNLDGLNDLVNHKQLLVEPGNPGDLARALVEALRTDFGRQHIDVTRTWDGVADAYIGAYRTAISRHRA